MCPRADVFEATVPLRDGRRLAFAALGPERGFPVLYLHGAIGAPLRPSPAFDAVVADLRIRYLMVSRPGFGASDPKPGRSILDFAADVEQLADALGLGRFAVVGVSAGGPYALACARELGDRVTATAAVSSLSALCPPFAVPGLPLKLRLALRTLFHVPGASSWLGDRFVGLVERHPALLARVMTAGASGPDRELLDDSYACDSAVAGFVAAASGGVRGLVDDFLLCSRPWGFTPASVDADVHVWHGMRDALVPVDHALGLAAALPRCRAAFDPDEGHFFFRRRLADILGALVADAHVRVSI